MTRQENSAAEADAEASIASDVSAAPVEAVPAWEDLPGGRLAALEAVLMVVDEPVTPAMLAGVLGRSRAQVEADLVELAAEYRGEREHRPRGFELREIAGAWRIYSAPAFSPAVEKFVLDGQTARLTQAALETLAVIAYRQPVTRGRISAVRGVNVDGVVRTLLARGLIEEAGHDDEGGAMLLRTTTYFLERMGLGSLEELPALAPYLPDLDVLGDIDGMGA